MVSKSPASPVLYVEDEENDIFLVEYGFRKAGVAQPLRALSNGQDAVHYLAGEALFADRDQHPLPCLVMLDLNLPLLSGIEVLQWVRKQASLKDLPVIVLSSSAQPSDKQKARELGATDYMLKPSDPVGYIEMARRLKERWLRAEDKS